VDFWAVTIYLSDEVSGYYYMASLISRVPFFIFLGLTATLLPTLSSELFAKRMQSVRGTIRISMRILLLFSAPVLVMVTLFSREIVSFVYTSQNAPAGDIVQILIWSITLLTLLSILTTIINADGKPTVSFILTGSCVLLDIVLNLILVPRYGVTGAAAATTIAVFTCFGDSVPFLTAAPF
jgi:stage V sporulation protein B